MKIRWLILMLAASTLTLTGCRTATVVEDSQLSGVYTAGRIHHGDGKTGYHRPYLDVDLAAGKLTVEENDRAIWSSPCRRDGDRLLIAAPKSTFPAELSIDRGGETNAGPVLRARSGTFFHRVTTTYTRCDQFPRRVGQPVPAGIAIKLDREVELTAAQRRLLQNVAAATITGLNYDFSRIEQLTPGGTVVTALDVPGQIVTVEHDPARPLIFSAKLRAADNFKLRRDTEVYQIYLRRDNLDAGGKQ